MKSPDELKSKMKQNIVTKHRVLFSHPRAVFPKQPMSPRGWDGKRQACRRLSGEARPPGLPELSSWLPLLAMWPFTSFSTPWCLPFLICKMGINLNIHFTGFVVKIKLVNMWKVLRTTPDPHTCKCSINSLAILWLQKKKVLYNESHPEES